MKRVFKYIFLILTTVMFLFISFKISNNYFINDYNLISMYESKGSQLKLIKKIPESPNLNLTYECKENAALSWDDTKRQIRFSSDTESTRCNLTFQYDVILTLNETSGTILKSNKKEVGIDGENYGKLTCESNNPTIASCTVTQTKLTVTGLNPGTATITVKDTTSDKQATFSATVTDVTLGLTPTSGSTTLNKTLTSTITGSNYGTLTCITSDSLIATCSISGATLTIKTGGKAGIATIIVKENLANKSVTYTANVDVLKLSWVKTFGGTNWDYFWDVIETADGGYIAAGKTFSEDIDITGITMSYEYDATAMLVKYDAAGNVVWKKFFGGSDTEEFKGVTAVSDGYIVIGMTWSKDRDLAGLNPNANNVPVLIKYDLNGNLIWKKIPVQGHNFEKIISVSDGVIVVGSKMSNMNWAIPSQPGPVSVIAAYIVKYNLSGNLVWQAYSHDGSIASSGFTNVVESNGGYVAVGNQAVAYYNGTSNLLITKFNKNGTKIYEKQYGELRKNGKLFGISSITEGVIIVGKVDNEATMAKLNNNGDVIWSYSYPGTATDVFNDVTTVLDGFVVVGNSTSTNIIPGKGSTDGLVLKISPSGSLVWVKHFGGNGADNFSSVLSSSSKIIIVGDTSSNNGDMQGLNKGVYDAVIYNFDY